MYSATRNCDGLKEWLLCRKLYFRSWPVEDIRICDLPIYKFLHSIACRCVRLFLKRRHVPHTTDSK